MKCITRTAAILLVITAATASQASDLKKVVRAFEKDFGVHQQHIPMMGFAMFAARVASGFQMPGVKVAMFDNGALSQVPSLELERSLRRALGPAWQMFVKTTSRHGEEQSWILVRPEGKQFRMFVATVEPSEVSLVEMKVSERKMRKWLQDKDDD
jgi:hypothetical protein